MLLANVVATSAALGETRSRRAKIELLARLLGELATDEVEPAVAWLAGAPRQGRTGTGWRTLAAARGEPAAEASLSVGDVDRLLTDLVGATGAGSVARRQAVLGSLFGAATAPEQEFLIRLLTGELRQGALEGIMADAVAAASGVPQADVRRAFMLSGRLSATAAIALDRGAEGLAEIRLEVGRPVRPMLASPAESLEAALADLGSDISVEFKLDGARIQVHRNGDEVRVFTRTLREITATVPELVERVRELPCDSVVLDGETLALTDSGRPRPFQETMQRFGADIAGAEPGEMRALLLQPYFFDCLYLDGVDLLDEPLSVRLEALDRVAGENRIPSLLRPNESEAAAHFDAALAGGHEGVMVKSLTSPYAAGRRGKAWQKIKPEHTLDLIVLGAEWGYGRRTGYLSNLHLGAADPNGGPPIMVGKTFKGLTDQLLQWQTEEFPRHERERDAGTVYLHPVLVVEIELDGVQVSTRYPGGVALRFARVLRYRPDKIVEQADTIDAVRALLPTR
ncbi:ATP-dependent DNA ligase [Aldersonia kunmingensis]|uniref:ATP-dependent DNA ligase n=1 Tax=Aldersonia kunmingensis TaxID=408066 RepID=UPI0008308D4C|nr:ATP-dependent DNA ligase [Aldersonia kunmingensis]